MHLVLWGLNNYYIVAEIASKIYVILFYTFLYKLAKFSSHIEKKMYFWLTVKINFTWMIQD